MPEAVIVSTARSPIGRAFKGSLKDVRPDDLAATIVRAALDKVPQLDPTAVEDLMLGCGLPGATLTRSCPSSLQTTRMAFHAIKAGEGEAFVSAGVEVVSRFVKGNSDSLPDTQNPLFSAALARTEERAKEGAGTWRDPR